MGRFLLGRRGTTTPLSDRLSSSLWICATVGGILTVVTMITMSQSVQDYSMLTLPQATNTNTNTSPSPDDGSNRIMTTNTSSADSDSLDTSLSSAVIVAVAVAPEYQLAFEQSLGFFDDIPNDLWTSYYQTRARKAEHYRVANNPNSKMEWTHHWNFFNWDP
jgi:hypothetical protein